MICKHDDPLLTPSGVNTTTIIMGTGLCFFASEPVFGQSL